MSLPSLSMEPGKARARSWCAQGPWQARDETKRILRLNYHRHLRGSPVACDMWQGGGHASHQHHRKRSGEDVEDVKLHSSPELREQRFLRQRVAYMRGLASSDVRSCINPCLGITTTRRMASMYLGPV